MPNPCMTRSTQQQSLTKKSRFFVELFRYGITCTHCPRAVFETHCHSYYRPVLDTATAWVRFPQTYVVTFRSKAIGGDYGGGRSTLHDGICNILAIGVSTALRFKRLPHSMLI